MATVTTKLDKRINKDNTQSIIIVVRHHDKRRWLPTGKYVAKEFFKDGKVTRKHPDHAAINAKINEIEGQAKKYIAECELYNRPIHLELIDKKIKSFSFTDYLEHRAIQYGEKDQVEMFHKLNRLAKELTDCFNRNLYFDEIDADLLRAYEAYLINQGNVNNTRAKKFDFLGRYFNNAIDEGKATGLNPFKKYKIPTTPVNKEKLTAEEIKRIEDLELDGPINDARNIFLLSFYCKGSRFENCLLMRRDQIIDGRIYIKMNKGKKTISVLIHSRLQAILDQYKTKDFIFPYVSKMPEGGKERRSVIGAKNTTVNKHLKIIAALAEVKKTLSFHISRHSFADQMSELTDNLRDVQNALGHSKLSITEVYVSALKDTALDKVMEKLYGK